MYLYGLVINSNADDADDTDNTDNHGYFYIVIESSAYSDKVGTALSASSAF